MNKQSISKILVKLICFEIANNLNFFTTYLKRRKGQNLLQTIYVKKYSNGKILFVVNLR